MDGITEMRRDDFYIMIFDLSMEGEVAITMMPHVATAITKIPGQLRNRNCHPN